MTADAGLIRYQLVGARAPDEVVDGLDEKGKTVPYLLRWFIKREEEGTGRRVYLHCFCRSDYDRALHDHPWSSTSIILEGEYLEHLQDGTVEHRKAGDVVSRSAEAQHRVELIGGRRCWTLFITGPKVREWGFQCKDGWVHNNDFIENGCA
jgi:hypothetical protein